MIGTRIVAVQRNQVQCVSEPIENPGPGQVRLRAIVTQISPGTERAFITEATGLKVDYPWKPGYSFIGEVEAVGTGVTQCAIGDRVAIEAGHASHVVVPENRLLPLPDKLSSEAAVFFALLAIAIQGVRRARIELGESVLVLGQGIVGQLALQVARCQGALPVIASDIDDKRLELAQSSGADAVIRADADNFIQQLHALTADGPNVTIEATGMSAPIRQAIQNTARFGRVVLLGSTRGTTEIDFYADVHRPGLTLLGAHNTARPQHDRTPGVWPLAQDAAVALQLLANERVQISHLLSHHIKPEEAPAFYQAHILNADPAVIGTLIDWS